MQLTQAIAQEYIQDKQLGAPFLVPFPPPPKSQNPTSASVLPTFHLWEGQRKGRGVHSNSNNTSSFGAWVEKSRQRSPRDGRKGWGAPFSSVGSTLMKKKKNRWNIILFRSLCLVWRLRGGCKWVWRLSTSLQWCENRCVSSHHIVCMD